MLNTETNKHCNSGNKHIEAEQNGYYFADDISLIYMFVGVNFDALAQAIFKSLRVQLITIGVDDMPIFEVTMVIIDYIDGLVQDCSNSIANALELLQSCTKPSITGPQCSLVDTTVTADFWLQHSVSKFVFCFRQFVPENTRPWKFKFGRSNLMAASEVHHSIDIFVFRFVAIGSFFSEMYQIHIWLKIQSQSHDQIDQNLIW